MSRSIFTRPVLKSVAIAATGSTAAFVSYRALSSAEQQKTPLVPLSRAADGSIIPPRFPKIKSREDQIADLRRSTENSSADTYDLLIIGGGATGTGIALDAVTRGLKVALVERDDFSSGTSSKSTKLVHGGVRYLEKAVWNLDYGQYALVKEALKERKSFLTVAPHLSTWLPIMLPLQKWWQAPYFWAGTKFYDFLAGSEGIESSYFLTKRKALEAFPMLKRQNLVGALVYYDGQHNDSRMNVSLAMTAALYGATVVNHVEVTGLEKDSNGQLTGAKVRDLIASKDGSSNQADSSAEFSIKARGVVNATGPFVDAIQQMDEPRKKDIVAPSLGVHLVLPGYLSPKNMGLIDPSTSDGRVVFFLPWQGNTIAGTTDAPCGISRNPEPTGSDVDWILNEVRSYLEPGIRISRDDVLSAWSGIRPLVRDPHSANTESLVRNHLIAVSQSKLLTISGGKWTTYRQMAEETVDRAVELFGLKPQGLKASQIPNIAGVVPNEFQQTPTEHTQFNGNCVSSNVPLLGAHGWSDTLYIHLLQKHTSLDEETARHLASNYGDRAWEVARLAFDSDIAAAAEKMHPSYPFLVAEVVHAVRSEAAQKPSDVLGRRTRLAFLDARAASQATDMVVSVMGAELKWNDERKEAERQATRRWLGSCMGIDLLEEDRQITDLQKNSSDAKAVLGRPSSTLEPASPLNLPA